jgi:hypothetical protein
MENDCAFVYLEDKYTFILQIIKVKEMYAMYTIGIWSLHWTLFTNTCLASPILCRNTHKSYAVLSTQQFSNQWKMEYTIQ